MTLILMSQNQDNLRKKMRRYNLLKLCIITLSASIANAGGMENNALQTGFMYKKKGYAELSYSSRKYDVTGTYYAPNGSALKNQNFISVAAKFNPSKKVSAGFTYYNQAGVQLDYSNAGSPNAPGLPDVDLDINAIAVMLKYQISKNFSLLGGAKKTLVQDAVANIFQAAGLLESNVKSGAELGYIVSVAYEQPKIALRVELLFESKTKLSLATTNTTAGNGVTTGSIPLYLTLNFQSGIAKNTLIFGSIHKADWSDNQLKVYPDPRAQTSDFADSITYNIGLGQKLNKEFSVFASYSTEAANDPTSTSLLSITDGYKGISIGANYSVKKLSFTAGVNRTYLGDVTVTPAGGSTGVFKHNTVDSYAITVGFHSL